MSLTEKHTLSHATYVHRLKSCTNTNSHLVHFQVHTKHQTDTQLTGRTQYSTASAILGSFQAAVNTVYNLRDKTAKWEEHLNDYTFILHFLLSAPHTHTFTQPPIRCRRKQSARLLLFASSLKNSRSARMRAGEERNRKADLRCTGIECDVRWHDRQESGP